MPFHDVSRADCQLQIQILSSENVSNFATQVLRDMVVSASPQGLGRSIESTFMQAIQKCIIDGQLDLITYRKQEIIRISELPSLFHTGEVEIVYSRITIRLLLRNAVIFCVPISRSRHCGSAIPDLGDHPLGEETSPLVPSEGVGPAGQSVCGCGDEAFHSFNNYIMNGKGSNLRSGSVFFCEENNFDVLIAGHILDCFQVADLHGSLATEDVCGLAHQFGGLDFGSGVEYLGLGEAFLLGDGGEDVLEFLVEDDVLDEDVGNFDAPLVYLPGHELPQFQRHLIALLQQFLQHVVAAHRPQGGEGQLLHALVDVGDAVEGSAGDFDVVVDCCVDVDLDVVAGQRLLPGEVDDVGLHVHDVDAVGEGVEVLQA